MAFWAEPKVRRRRLGRRRREFGKIWPWEEWSKWMMMKRGRSHEEHPLLDAAYFLNKSLGDEKWAFIKVNVIINCIGKLLSQGLYLGIQHRKA
jgi:hypothetical protein